MSLPPPPLPPQTPPPNARVAASPIQYQSPGVVNAGDPVARLIPYKNWPALTGYYLGLFSLFPVLGLPLGITAIVFGVMGIKRSNANPEVRGKGHAITALISGSLSTIMNLFFVGAIVFALLTAHSRHV